MHTFCFGSHQTLSSTTDWINDILLLETRESNVKRNKNGTKHKHTPTVYTNEWFVLCKCAIKNVRMIRNNVYTLSVCWMWMTTMCRDVDVTTNNSDTTICWSIELYNGVSQLSFSFRAEVWEETFSERENFTVFHLTLCRIHSTWMFRRHIYFCYFKITIKFVSVKWIEVSQIKFWGFLEWHKSNGNSEKNLSLLFIVISIYCVLTFMEHLNLSLRVFRFFVLIFTQWFNDPSTKRHEIKYVYQCEGFFRPSNRSNVI